MFILQSQLVRRRSRLRSRHQVLADRRASDRPLAVLQTQGEERSNHDAAIAFEENGESKILIAGEVGLSHGSGVKNWQFGHAVAYAGASGGLAIALHKRETDFTSFRHRRDLFDAAA